MGCIAFWLTFISNRLEISSNTSIHYDYPNCGKVFFVNLFNSILSSEISFSCKVTSFATFCLLNSFCIFILCSSALLVPYRRMVSNNEIRQIKESVWMNPYYFDTHLSNCIVISLCFSYRWLYVTYLFPKNNVVVLFLFDFLGKTCIFCPQLLQSRLRHSFIKSKRYTFYSRRCAWCSWRKFEKYPSFESILYTDPTSEHYYFIW